MTTALAYVVSNEYPVGDHRKKALTSVSDWGEEEIGVEKAFIA